VNHIWKQRDVAHQLTGSHRLAFTASRQWHIYPPGEQVLGIPLTLTMAEQDEGSYAHAVQPATHPIQGPARGTIG
jgi:hypothetical protein